MKDTLEDNFEKVTDELDTLDENREEVLKISRNIIRECSNAIKSIHRSNFDEYTKKIERIEQDLDDMRNVINESPGYLYKYLKTPEQEYVEAIVLNALINDKNIPDHTKLNVDALHYSLGLADVVGELRRHVLDNIRNSNVDEINKILEKMDEIYSYLFSLDYPSGLTKDLRHKTDTARNLIEKTRADVSLSVQMNTLSSLLKGRNEDL
ncbi:MAG: Translin family protein [Promethearchaeota archaeon]|nr:MAG: Translin family protein [Candidatus Lokiarchaeota archaeon]